MPQFSSYVRLVQLSAAVVDSTNRPVPGLGLSDFRILEDGVEQQIGMVQDSVADFNLILLLDCSTSTLVDREAVMEAARQFILTALPMDRVGIYVLSGAYLHVVSPLTADREALLRTIGQIPRLSGGTPLYDAITLSYAHELAKRRWERNALIVISDGMDNEPAAAVEPIHPVPSAVRWSSTCGRRNQQRHLSDLPRAGVPGAAHGAPLARAGAEVDRPGTRPHAEARRSDRGANLPCRLDSRPGRGLQPGSPRSCAASTRWATTPRIRNSMAHGGESACC